jgi:hypothetical protein
MCLKTPCFDTSTAEPKVAEIVSLGRPLFECGSLWGRTVFHSGPIAEISGAETIHVGNQRDARWQRHRVRGG